MCVCYSKIIKKLNKLINIRVYLRSKVNIQIEFMHSNTT